MMNLDVSCPPAEFTNTDVEFVHLVIMSLDFIHRGPFKASSTLFRKPHTNIGEPNSDVAPNVPRCEHDNHHFDCPQNDSERWVMLRTAHHEYHAIVTAEYDEALYTVAQRYTTDQSIGKVEIGGLLFWKRLQANTPWAMDLMNLSDQHV